MPLETKARRYPVGPAQQSDGSVHFRVWAPACSKVELVFEEGEEAKFRELSSVELKDAGGGYFEGSHIPKSPLYRYRLNDKKELYPDPASIYQPFGPAGPSMVYQNKFQWTDEAWEGPNIDDVIIYEMHIGTFTEEGTWRAAAAHLPRLKEIGITVLEVMPINEFPGRFGWGYDGVNVYAPTRLYGTPDDAKYFVNEAHKLGIAVTLDVVYSHFGPEHNYICNFSPDYTTTKYECEWGAALNFDGPNSESVREFFISNAEYWIEEFHFDGLRLDATQQVFDDSPVHVLAEMIKRCRACANGRKLLFIGENEPQRSEVMRPLEEGGWDIDLMWNDDFHHTAKVALTGTREAYYLDYLGSAQELVSCAKWGYLYQGQRYKWQGKSRGSSALDISPKRFVHFVQNHDQVANSVKGERIDRLSSPCRLRAVIAYQLLMPNTPLLFQGQEFGATTPFLYFADMGPDIAPLVEKGRAQFLSQFPSIGNEKSRAILAVPNDENTYSSSKLLNAERTAGSAMDRLHRDLLRLRRTDPGLRLRERGRFDGAVLSKDAFLLRYFSTQEGDRLILVNLGTELILDPAPEPLLAPILGWKWQLLWASTDIEYGGSGVAQVISEDGEIRIAGESTVLLGGKRI